MDEHESDIEMPQAISFDDFWRWLSFHSDCILRAGFGPTVVYDDDDYHWHLTSLDEDTVVFQVIRGKRLVVEMAVQSQTILQVRENPAGEEEFMFELLGEVDDRLQPVGFVALRHGYDDESVGPNVQH